MVILSNLAIGGYFERFFISDITKLSFKKIKSALLRSHVEFVYGINSESCSAGLNMDVH